MYGIYKGNQLIDTYTTDASGQFTTKYYICGDDWTIREISPSEGYLINTESLHIGAEAKLYTVEYNIAKPLDSYEDIIKGKIAIIKHCDDGTTKIETPEVGAEFEVYLKAAGSYENAKETERDMQNGITERLNEVIADPERIEVPESTYEESQEVKRMSAEIVKTLDTLGFDKEALKQKMLTCVSEKYKCLGTEVTTAQSLKDTFKSASPLTAYDSALADQTVSEIHLQRNGEINLTLINGQRIGKEETA